nr:putative F-box protein At3g52320 [Ipomoea batatas]
MPGFDMITARIRDSFRSSRRPDHVISVLENNEMVTVGWVKTHVFVQIPHERVLITLFHRVNGGYPLSSEEDEPMVENVDEPVYAPLYESHAFVVHFGHMDKVFDMLKEHEHVSFRIVGPEADNPADLHVLARITYRNMFDIDRRDQIYMHVQDQVDVPQSIWHGIRYHQNLLFHITCESLRSLFHSFHLLSGQENITRMLISNRGIELRARELPSRIMHIVPVDMGEGEVEYTVSSTVLDPLLRIFSGGNATFYALDGPRLLVKTQGRRGAMSFSKMASVDFLPKEILVQILSKLPAKSLVRFKCVSEFFCSLIVDHSFADLHRNWSLTLPSSRMSILISLPICVEDARLRWHYTINYSEENQGILHANRLRYIDDDGNLFRKVYISSSVDGLICFCTYSRLGDAIAIHNLSTRKHISLPSSIPSVGRDSGSRMTAFGLLGFDSVSRRYKVLKSVHYTNRSYNRHVLVKHWVFTLGVDKSWREIHSSPAFHPYTCFNNHFYFRTSVHIDGIIYSLNSLNKGEIVTFDVRVENFSVTPPPPPATIPGLVEGPAGVDSGRSGLVEVDGRLAIVDLISDNLRYGMAIWILEELAWKKQYLIFIPIPRQEIHDFNEMILFVATNHVGEIAVLVRQNICLSILFYNFKRQSWRKFEICKLPLGSPMYPKLYPAMYFNLDNIFVL